MSKYIQHNKKCYACGRQLSKTLIGYHPETLKSYCLDRQRCPGFKNHPGTEDLIPIDRERLKNAIEFKFKGAIKDILLAQVGKTSSLRPNPAMVVHLMKHAQENNIMSMNATLLDIIEQHMQDHPYDDVVLEYCGWEVNAPQSFPASKGGRRRNRSTPAQTQPSEPQTKREESEVREEKPKDEGFFGGLEV